MRFINESGRDLDFELAGTRYQVRPHETIDVPDRYAYAVEKHGLPLTPDGDVPPMGGVAPKPVPVATVVDDENGDDPPPFSEPAPSSVGTEPPADASGQTSAPPADTDPDDQGSEDPPASADEVDVDDGTAQDSPTSVGTEPPADASGQTSAPRLTKKQRKALAAGK